MKILQIHNFYRVQGGECSVVNAEKLLLEEYGNTVITYYMDSREIDNWSIVKKVKMFFSIPYSEHVAQDLAELVRKESPDLAHIHNVFPLLSPSVYRSLKSCNVPVVQTVHNFRLLCPNGQFYIRNEICEACQIQGFSVAVKKRCMQDSFIVSRAYSAALENAWKDKIIPNDIDRYIALNHFFAEKHIKAGIARSRVAVLGNFISDMLETVPEKNGYVLYLGRLSEEKGLRTLLDAWRRIEGSVLKIAGSGPLMNEVKTIATRMGDREVQILGHVTGDDKRDLIKGAICVVVPSEWYENFPISVVEAMANGTPVVASRIGGLPDLVIHEETGLLFEPGNSAALEAALSVLISDNSLANRLAENALRYARDNLGPQKHYDSLIDIYNQAINDG